MELLYIDGLGPESYDGGDAQPTQRQRTLEYRVRFMLSVVRSMTSRLSVRQQIAILRIVRDWGVYVAGAAPAGYSPEQWSSVAPHERECRASVAPFEPRQLGGGDARSMQPLQ